ncbi:fluoride efflux transporter FluC [Streptomonospora salina]|uniref:Fluoride-specific ion channel FluC n=1 Tax=Streptomonospora salina TaxID=104205 RepID=A0A841E7L0_9ACTN|nr:CrcB family protein [Streptomonospora salina]MBB5998996.1 CrcB protein [Streptomonospora salina]
MSERPDAPHPDGGASAPGEASAAGPAPPSVDPDIDLHVPRERRELRDAPWAVLAAVSLGGALGGAARSALGLALPQEAGGVPWATLSANLSGCLLIGVLMTVLVRARPDSKLLRPFAGVGVLGGYTTFSAHIADVRGLLEAGVWAGAVGYIGATLLGGLTAVWAGAALTESLLDRRAAKARPGAGRGGGENGEAAP